MTDRDMVRFYLLVSFLSGSLTAGGIGLIVYWACRGGC